jgi:hypothetical protein
VGNTSYTFSVLGTNGTGDGIATASTTQLTLPDIPTSLSFTSIAQNTLRVTWSAPTGGASTYKVERCLGPACSNLVEVAAGVATTFYDDSGLSAAATYSYRIRATNTTGDSLYTATSTVTTSSGGGGGGGNGGGLAIGGNAPAGQGTNGGGSQGTSGNTGDEIGTEPGFIAPTAGATATGWGTGWTNPGNALTQDGSLATAASFSASDYSTFGFNIPAGDTITGIIIKLIASGSTAAGSVGTELSWNGGSATTTSSFVTSTLTTTGTLYQLGGPAALWGRSWSSTDFSDANFRLRLIANPSGNTVKVDAIQVRVVHQATGGGNHGGGEI